MAERAPSKMFVSVFGKYTWILSALNLGRCKDSCTAGVQIKLNCLNIFPGAHKHNHWWNVKKSWVFIWMGRSLFLSTFFSHFAFCFGLVWFSLFLVSKCKDEHIFHSMNLMVLFRINHARNWHVNTYKIEINIGCIQRHSIWQFLKDFKSSKT